jgi:uncharacterized membrane protein
MFGSPLMPPPLPPWEGVHPLIVHFPIALLLVAPLFVLLGLLPRIGGAFRWAALVLLVLGTTGAYVAVEAGEAAKELVVQTPRISEVLSRHEELGESVEAIFTIVTAVYAVVLIVPPVLKKTGLLKKGLPRPIPLIGQLVVLAALLVCSLVLANTGDLGGRLVHEFGVQAWMGPPK